VFHRASELQVTNLDELSTRPVNENPGIQTTSLIAPYPVELSSVSMSEFVGSVGFPQSMASQDKLLLHSPV